MLVWVRTAPRDSCFSTSHSSIPLKYSSVPLIHKTSFSSWKCTYSRSSVSCGQSLRCSHPTTNCPQREPHTQWMPGSLRPPWTRSPARAVQWVRVLHITVLKVCNQSAEQKCPGLLKMTLVCALRDLLVRLIAQGPTSHFLARRLTRTILRTSPSG